MTNESNFYLPGGDGKWDSAPLPDNLEDAQERIRVLSQALAFYSDVRSYEIDSMDNEYPTYSELMEDSGVRARIGRLATTVEQYGKWSIWASAHKKK